MINLLQKYISSIITCNRNEVLLVHMTKKSLQCPQTPSLEEGVVWVQLYAQQRFIGCSHVLTTTMYNY